MRIFTMILMLGFAQSAAAQDKNPPEEQEIVVTGLADGARVVEVDFDKVWKGCAECKRTLAKLDRLAQGYRDELEVAGHFSSGGSTNHCSKASPSPLLTFQRSSAEPIAARPKTAQSLADELCAARVAEISKKNFAAVAQQYVRPEQSRLLAHMRSFLDQLGPHLNEATEAERVAHGANAGLTDTKRTRLSAKNLKRIDVTEAVIRRLDAKDFTIVLPDPPARGPARK